MENYEEEFENYNFDQFIESPENIIPIDKQLTESEYMSSDEPCINCNRFCCDCNEDLPNDWVWDPEYKETYLIDSEEEEKIINQLLKEQEEKIYKHNI